MTNKDEILLSEAYLSISKPVPSVPSDEIDSMDIDSGYDEVDGSIDDGSEEMGIESPEECEKHSSFSSFSMDSMGDEGEESEEDAMVISNLDSIRESVTKVASFCAGGGHLESWQQQKLAIAMDNLAEVARRIRR